MSSRKLSSPAGFTLVEALIVLAILAVLMSLAAPSWGGLIGRSHGRAAQNLLATALSQARATAVSRARHVVMCPSLDGAQCHPGTAWQHGWIMFADLDRDGLPGPHDTLLAVGQAMPSGTAIISTVGRTRVNYRPDGSATGTNQTLTICDRRDGSTATALIISQAGRVRSAPATPAALAACLQAAG